MNILNLGGGALRQTIPDKLVCKIIEEYGWTCQFWSYLEHMQWLWTILIEYFPNFWLGLQLYLILVKYGDTCMSFSLTLLRASYRADIITNFYKGYDFTIFCNFMNIREGKYFL